MNLFTMFRDELELCGVDASQTVAILTRGARHADYADAFEAAAFDLGATVFQVRIPDLPGLRSSDPGSWRADQLGGNGPAIAALSGSDLVVDLLNMVWTAPQVAILAAGARVLSCHEPVEVLARLFPTAARAAQVSRSAAILGEAQVLRVQSEHGTDLTYRLGSYGVLAQRGYVDTPGTWDHFASALVATCGADDGVDGTLVLVPGDVVLQLRRFITDPVTFTIEGGRIRSIEGGTDARMIRTYMESFGDPFAFGLSHVGWGLAETAQWEAIQLDSAAGGIENRSAYGRVMCSTGPNTEFGGTNHTRCHLDIPMYDASLALDGVTIVEGGDLVERGIRSA